SMEDMHLAALELAITADNWSGPVGVRSGIDGRVVNAGAKLYVRFNNKHLVPVAAERLDGDAVYLLVRTSQSHLRVGTAVRTQAYVDGNVQDPERQRLEEPGYIGQDFEVRLEQGETLTLEKVACLYTS